MGFCRRAFAFIIVAASTATTIACGSTVYSLDAANDAASDAGADGATATSADGSSTQAGDGTIPRADAVSVPTDDASTGDGSPPSAANVDCKQLASDTTVVFCADFSGSVPFGFSSTSINSGNVTTTQASLNGGTSIVLDLSSATQSDGGMTLDMSFGRTINRPASGLLSLDFDLRVGADGYDYMTLGAFEMSDGMANVEVGVGVLPGEFGRARDPAQGQGTVAYTTTSFHHARATIDFSMTPQTRALFIDGVSIDTTTAVLPAGDVSLFIGPRELATQVGGATHVQLDNVVVRLK